MTDLIKRDDALLPCPFCKCEEVTTWFDREQGEKWGYASCDGCAARGPEVRTNWDREPDAPWHSEAIAEWNTRALPAVPTHRYAGESEASVYDRKGFPPIEIAIDPAAIPALQARIEELENSLAWYKMMDAMSSDHVVELTDKLEAAEAKLTKALEALRFYTHDYVFSGSKARATLAELEEEK